MGGGVQFNGLVQYVTERNGPFPYSDPQVGVILLLAGYMLCGAATFQIIESDSRLELAGRATQEGNKNIFLPLCIFDVSSAACMPASVCNTSNVALTDFITPYKY